MVTIIVIKISQKLCSWRGGDYIVAQNKETKYCVISENKTQVGDDKNFVKNLRVYSS